MHVGKNEKAKSLNSDFSSQPYVTPVGKGVKTEVPHPHQKDPVNPQVHMGPCHYWYFTSPSCVSEKGNGFTRKETKYNTSATMGVLFKTMKVFSGLPSFYLNKIL